MKSADIKEVKVKYRDREVGRLSMTRQGLAAFQYSESWLKSGFSISPISLPLSNKVYISEREPFNGLFGVFDDSLPDGWGRLIIDRYLSKKGFDIASINFLTRLTLLSSNAVGALEYEPSNIPDEAIGDVNFDYLKTECDKLLKSAPSESFDTILRLGGSSGGARPKAHITINDEEWIVKFPSSYDPENIGKLEYDYSLAAKECGIEMTETRLFASSLTSGYFGTKRFDRVDGKKLHVISAGGLLETSHRYPVLDYELLFKLSLYISKDGRDIERLFRLMCFNVYSHNLDDHAKNFSFIYDEDSGWSMSPSYDLTYSNTYSNEHATTVNRKGNPKDLDILTLGKKYLKEVKAKAIMNDIKEIVSIKLKDYLE